ncbi:MAG TPA: hypothetical protein PLU73_13290 [Bacteroidia bacterium]|nr:hypothetical protein [Bacteroidia bacterium]
MIDLAEIKDLSLNGFSQEMILAKFKEQLVKDFSMCRIDLEFPESDELKASDYLNSIKNGLKHLDNSTFMELLYRIDLPEARLSKEIRENIEQERDEIVAILIFKRILQKVVLKLSYSTK